MSGLNGGGNPTRVDGGAGTTLQLVITYDQLTGGVQVSGPINNSAVCYGIEGLRCLITSPRSPSGN
jgi:hypothetical protein